MTEKNPEPDGHTFDCPRCDHSAEFRWLSIGAFLVFAHFFVRHGTYSFKVGCPLFDEEPPEPEEMGL